MQQGGRLGGRNLRELFLFLSSKRSLSLCHQPRLNKGKGKQLIEVSETYEIIILETGHENMLLKRF